MPVFALLIAPLLALYIKYKLFQWSIKLILFASIYIAFKQGMEFVLQTVLGKMVGLNFPCPIAFVMNGLDIFGMVNFALSLWATIYVARFFYNTVARMI